LPRVLHPDRGGPAPGCRGAAGGGRRPGRRTHPGRSRPGAPGPAGASADERGLPPPPGRGRLPRGGDHPHQPRHAPGPAGAGATGRLDRSRERATVAVGARGAGPAPRGGRRGASLLARSRRAFQPPGARGRPAVQPAARRGDGLRPVPLPRRPCGALPRPPAGLGGGGGGEPPVRAGGVSRPRSADGRPPPHFQGQDAPLPGAVERGVPTPACVSGLRERAGAGRAARGRREEGAGAPAPGEPQGAERLGRRLGGGPAALPLGERHHAAPGPLRRGGELLMLEPDTSVLLTDALRPPPGHEVDVAVTTTYSLNLTAMLIAPTTFALASMDEATRIDDGDPAQLLDAVQRFMGRTTVFCQAAGIHVPRSHSRIHTFLEDSLHEVEAPREGALFHPKLWAIRYRRAHDGSYFHRVVVGSRNLTLDSSWDTALVLDE